LNSVYNVKETLFSDKGLSTWKPDNDVHVWKFPVIPLSSSLLNEAETETAERFRFEGDRNRYSVGRHALRTLLSKYLSINPIELTFSAGGGKKPVIKNPSAGIHFNISHSGEWVIIGIASRELGIDIEKIDPAFEFQDLLQEHFITEEKDFIAEAPDPYRAFYYLWTRKEALTKAWGTGLQENLKEVRVLDKNSGFELNKKNWKLESFNISELYPAAIAFPQALERVHFLDGSAFLISF
jgi:4'-phosphopantetheinyl transferase